MADRRHKDVRWNLAEMSANRTLPTADVQLAILMDIRDELQALRWRLDCHETLSIPRLLREIRRNTAKPERKRKLQLVKRKAA